MKEKLCIQDNIGHPELERRTGGSSPYRETNEIVTGGPSHNMQSPAASPGMICIAILIQRSSDKSPAIRSKALSNLAGILRCAVEDGKEEYLTAFRHVSGSRMRQQVTI